jgi:hypothetical protein
VDPGKAPRLMTLSPLHSVAHWITGLHWACAEPAVSPSRQTATH